MLTDSIFKDLKHHFLYGNVIVKLIFVNIAVFLVYAISFLVGEIIRNHVFDTWLADQLQIHSTWQLILYKPWTIITHMFTHLDPMHILGNMVFMYFFGQIFILYMGEKQVVPLYLFSGLCGLLLALLAINFIPYIGNGADHKMVGASAAILGLVFATVAINPDHKVNLFFIGETKIMYVAVVPLVFGLLSIPYGNAGGQIAHLGGALGGYCYMKLRQSGIDIFSPIDKIAALFKPKSPLRTTYRNDNYRRPAEKTNTKTEQQRVDEILDKIARSGYDSLNKEEREFLFHYSKK